jgi:hypothetical protein
LLLDDRRRQKRIETTFDRRNLDPRAALDWFCTLLDGLTFLSRSGRRQNQREAESH